MFNRGDGQDVINDYNVNNYGGADRMVFGAGIQSYDLWFSRDGNDLLIDTVGTDDQVRVENWHAGSNYPNRGDRNCRFSSHK